MNQAYKLRDLAAFVGLIAPSLGKCCLNVLKGIGTWNLQEGQCLHKRCCEMYCVIVLLSRKICHSSEILHGRMVICGTARLQCVRRSKEAEYVNPGEVLVSEKVSQNTIPA